MDNRSFVLACLVLVILVGFSAFSSATKSTSIFSTGNTTFQISSNREVVSNSLTINGDQNTIVFFNGHNEGPTPNSLPLNHFEQGENKIEFGREIENFTLTYQYRVGEGSSCQEDSDCQSDSCIFGYCWGGGDPITFTAPIEESCAESSIPVHPEPEAYWVSNDISIDIYLGSQKIDDDCTIDGDPGWDLNGEARCEAKIPTDFSTGDYELEARYSVGGNQYQYTIDSDFSVQPECSTDVKSNHGGGIRESVTGNFHANPSVQENGNYLIPPGTEVEIRDFHTLTAICSNGVESESKPGVVTWTYDSSGNRVNIGDNTLFDGGDCKIEGKSRGNLIGPTSSTSGYKPPKCDIGWTSIGNDEKAEVYTFNQPGDYSVKVDYINAVSDAPDYICPDLSQSNKDRSGICKIGAMSNWDDADGWKHLYDYSIKVVNPEIDYQKNYLDVNGFNVTIGTEVSNIGTGKVDITPSLSSSDFDPTFNYLSTIQEGGSTSLVVNLGLNTNEITINSITPAQYKIATLRDYQDVVVGEDEITLEYGIPFEIEYDDGYGFGSVGPSTLDKTLDFNMTFSCSGKDYALNLTDKIYYCFCDNRSFYEDRKGTDDQPFACIGEPLRGEHIEGEEDKEKKYVTLSANKSFDDNTLPGNLNFSWYEFWPLESGTNKLYSGVGQSGASAIIPFYSSGEHHIRLKINDGTKIGKQETYFLLSLNPNYPECVDNGRYWLENGDREDSLDDCYREDGKPGPKCCPWDKDCEEKNGQWKCMDTVNPVSYCANYSSEETCENDPNSVADFSVEGKPGTNIKCDSTATAPSYGENCYKTISCSCEWNDEANGGNGGCEPAYERTIDCDGNEVCQGSCHFNIKRDTGCNYGFRIMSWNYTWGGNDSCREGCSGGETEKIPCLTRTLLSFFGILAIVLGSVLIAIFYLSRKRKDTTAEYKNL